jgi:hypothetical protein
MRDLETSKLAFLQVAHLETEVPAREGVEPGGARGTSRGFGQSYGIVKSEIKFA